MLEHGLSVGSYFKLKLGRPRRELLCDSEPEKVNDDTVGAHRAQIPLQDTQSCRSTSFFYIQLNFHFENHSRQFIFDCQRSGEARTKGKVHSES
jgi:hypothetical protein